MGEEEVKHNCGICVGHSLHDVYKMLDEGGLQHRGHDATGIFCLKDDGGIDGIRWQGRTKDFSREALGHILDGGYLFIGEVRYSTNKGKTDQDLIGGALPRFLGGQVSSVYEFPYLPHMVVRGANYAMIHNGHFRGFIPKNGDTDTDVALKFYALQEEKGIERIIETFPSAYSSAILDYRNDFAILFKDRYSIRPLWIGEKDGRIVAASEDSAIAGIGGKPIREVRSGEMVRVFRNSTNFSGEVVMSKNKRPCFFERLYLGSRESTYNGIHNKDTRRRGGVALAHELLDSDFDLESVDFVSYIPNAPEDYGRACADVLKKPFLHVFYKVDPKRAFLEPDEFQRGKSIKYNLCINDKVKIEGKKGLFAEDSVVRFNNAGDASRKLDEKGILWKGLLVATPPLGPVVDGVRCGCEAGVDMPPDDNFAIRKFADYQEMARQKGWDYIHYLSKKNLEERVLRRPLNKCCARCIGESDPVSEEELNHLPEVISKIYDSYRD